MINTKNSKITYDKPYSSGPKANTDLHAGGLFFCVAHEVVLTFSKLGIVEKSTRVVGEPRPMDEYDLELVNRKCKEMQKTRYFFNNRGYLEFSFDGNQYTGMPLEGEEDVLAFCVHPKTGYMRSECYRLIRGADEN